MRVLTIVLTAALFQGCAQNSVQYSGSGAPREAVIAPLESERPVIALALGSGGARGFAHVGVIEVLEAAGIEADVVTGASSGAVVAALYAGGRPASGLRELALGLDQAELVDFAVFGSGWVKGEALARFVNRHVDGRPIEALARRFAVVATQARSGRMAVFNRGDTGAAVRASASVPNLFVPPVINGEQYVDGGLSSPVPARLARAMGADIVIAVDVSWFAQQRDPSAPAMARHARSGHYALREAELAAADVVITPRSVPMRLLDFEQREASLEAGAEAAREALPRIRELLAAAAARKHAGRATITAPVLRD
jgi:NTE family protein